MHHRALLFVKCTADNLLYDRGLCDSLFFFFLKELLNQKNAYFQACNGTFLTDAMSVPEPETSMSARRPQLMCPPVLPEAGVQPSNLRQC